MIVIQIYWLCAIVIFILWSFSTPIVDWTLTKLFPKLKRKIHLHLIKNELGTELYEKSMSWTNDDGLCKQFKFKSLYFVRIMYPSIFILLIIIGLAQLIPIYIITRG